MTTVYAEVSLSLLSPMLDPDLGFKTLRQPTLSSCHRRPLGPMPASPLLLWCDMLTSSQTQHTKDNSRPVYSANVTTHFLNFHQYAVMF